MILLWHILGSAFCLGSGYYYVEDALIQGLCLFVNTSHPYPSTSGPGYFLQTSNCSNGIKVSNIFYWNNSINVLLSPQLGNYCLDVFRGNHTANNLLGVYQTPYCSNTTEQAKYRWNMIGLGDRYAISDAQGKSLFLCLDSMVGKGARLSKTAQQCYVNMVSTGNSINQER